MQIFNKNGVVFIHNDKVCYCIKNVFGEGWRIYRYFNKIWNRIDEIHTFKTRGEAVRYFALWLNHNTGETVNGSKIASCAVCGTVDFIHQMTKDKFNFDFCDNGTCYYIAYPTEGK